jgi:pyruvate/2-oxoglutarate dehydrogenase complex dihydrolipoamide acyltransferase (E2) component
MIKVVVPKIDSSSTIVEICSINVCVGELVQKDQVLVEIESHKKSSEITSPEKGYIREILINEGDEVQISKPLFIITSSIDEEYEFKQDSFEETNKSRPSLRDIIDRETNIKSESPTQFQKGMLSTLNLDLDPISYIEKEISVKSLHSKINTKKSALNLELMAISWAFLKNCDKDEKLYSYYEDESIKTIGKLNLGITSEFDKKLYFLNIPYTDNLTFKEFLNKYFYLQKKLITGKLATSESNGYSIAISSLANLDVVRHRAILPKGVSIIISHAVTKDNNSVLGLSFDHRVHTGAEMGRLLSSIESLVKSSDFLESLDE